jgi:hypothetical protein
VKQPKPTFVSDSVNASFCSSFGSLDMNQVLYAILLSQILCYYSCFSSRVISLGSTKTPKQAASLFRETAETNILVSDSVKASFGSIFGSFNINRVSQDTLATQANYIKKVTKLWILTTAYLYTFNLINLWFHKNGFYR